MKHDSFFNETTTMNLQQNQNYTVKKPLSKATFCRYVAELVHNLTISYQMTFVHVVAREK